MGQPGYRRIRMFYGDLGILQKMVSQKKKKEKSGGSLGELGREKVFKGGYLWF
jgi:hypothetical protein